MSFLKSQKVNLIKKFALFFFRLFLNVFLPQLNSTSSDKQTSKGICVIKTYKMKANQVPNNISSLSINFPLSSSKIYFKYLYLGLYPSILYDKVQGYQECNAWNEENNVFFLLFPEQADKFTQKRIRKKVKFCFSGKPFDSHA